jgi:probable phosphoglycerate mutase
MSLALPRIYLARHGETAWTISGQHTGLTDLPLTQRGEHNARSLGERLRNLSFARVYCSPLLRARRTCELAGYAPLTGGAPSSTTRSAEIDPDLVEWNYGEYEGLRTAEILVQRPGWQLFRDGCPGGESVEQIAARADRVIGRLRSLDADSLVFSSGHFFRVLAARWLSLPPTGGRFLVLDTAALSVLGYEHDRNEPVLRLWNDARHTMG